MDELSRKVLNRIQSGFPLVSRPYQALAEELGVEEAEVLECVRRLKAEGIIRRIGAVFDSQKLGFYSTLVAMRVPEERVEEVAGVVNTYPGVTHNYLRPAEYNLWFTLTAESPERVEEILQEISRCTGIQDWLNLPAERLFKIRVDFKV